MALFGNNFNYQAINRSGLSFMVSFSFEAEREFYPQILNSTFLRRLKLFDQIEIERKSQDCYKDCCKKPLTENEVDLLDESFEVINKLSDVETIVFEIICSVLYYNKKQPFEILSYLSLV